MSSPTPKPKMPGEVPTGVVGLILTGIFSLGILIAPGGFYSVMIGGILSLAGLVVSLIGAIRGSGRWAGVVGIVLFFFGWAYNTWYIGRL